MMTWFGILWLDLIISGNIGIASLGLDLIIVQHLCHISSEFSFYLVCAGLAPQYTRPHDI